MFNNRYINADLGTPCLGGLGPEYNAHIPKPQSSIWALDFDGNNDLINHENDASLNLTSSFTIIVKFKSDLNDANFRALFTKWKAAPGKQFWFGHQNSKLFLDISPDGNSDSTSQATDTFSTGEWVFGAIVFDDNANTAAFSLNGIEDSGGVITENDSPSSEIATKVYIGNDEEEVANAKHNGLIKEAVFFEGAKPIEEIRNIMNGVVDPVTMSGLKLYSEIQRGFGASDGIIIKEESPENNIGVLKNFTGTPWVNVGINPQ